MRTIDFKSVANLINRSAYTKIDTDPIKHQKDKWSLYEGKHKPPPGFEYPFYVLYIYSDATKISLDKAEKALIDRSQTIVVYASSLDANTKYHHDLFRKEVAGFYTTREYLLAFVKEKIQTYQNELKSIAPQYYVDPHFEVPSGFKRKFPNPLRLLLDYDQNIPTGSSEGMLTILLAEPGQGKTYQSKYLASTLADTNIIPIFIQSEQWYNLAFEDLSSLWKTITHSFKYFQSPIDWIEGYEQEFLNITLRAGLFTIIFDGFDEYILWNQGTVNSQDVIQALSELAKDTGAPILLTSRTSFWNSVIISGQNDSEYPVYTLLPFDRNNARVYFNKRFDSNSTQVDRALAIFDMLRKGGTSQLHENIAGRGFILYHIADIVTRTDKNPPTTTQKFSVIQWVMNALCEREQKRQNLPINSAEQIEILRYFAEETSMGSEPDTNTLRNIITVYFSHKLTNDQIDALVEAPNTKKRGSLQDHPLIKKNPSNENWIFVQEQIRFSLLAEQIINHVNKGDKSSLKYFLDNITSAGSLYIDIAAALVDQICTSSEEGDSYDKIKELISALIDCYNAASIRKGDPKRNLATTLAIISLDRLIPKGFTRKDRTTNFLGFFPDSMLKDLLFSGTIASMDFSGVKFETCHFNQVTFANCLFDDDTIFDYCTFSGGKILNSPTLGKAKWNEGWFDLNSKTLINLAKISAGKKEYSQEEVKKDIECVVNKFIPREGHFILVSESALSNGTISHSPNKNIIIKYLTKWILEKKKTSDDDIPYSVKDEAREAVLHYNTNGVLTGPLAEAYSEIIKKLKIKKSV